MDKRILCCFTFSDCRCYTIKENKHFSTPIVSSLSEIIHFDNLYIHTWQVKNFKRSFKFWYSKNKHRINK